MKIKGKKIEGPNVEFIVIPRTLGDNIVFKVQAILDMEAFDQICPLPIPPKKRFPDGSEVPNLKDPTFLKQLGDHSTKRLAWIVLTSLQATEGLEWENVDLSDHTTWGNFRKELRESGFCEIEVNRIVAGCVNVNALNEEKIEAARERFLQIAQEALNE